MKVIIYTDGASKGNPGPGGYGVVLLAKVNDNIVRKELSQGYKNTTNNRMELMAVIKGIEALRYPNTKVTVYTDSKYIVDTVTKKWLDSWVKKGFKGKKNADLWKKYLSLSKNHNITFCWVKGHAGLNENERCDTLAVKAALGTNLIDDIGFLSK